ncbi:hypothetical protein PQR68_23380 [Paraburkholderia agricolaris]|uniref:hypothetical protein n=1 Tax=Paraburkholderia agricolaris TaxID=2152888 RepID=UPI0038BA84BF
MSHYKPYSSYEDSGTEWLGKLPAHWDVKPLKWLGTYQNSNVDKKSYAGQTEVRLCNYTDVYYNERITDSLDFMVATASDSEIESMTLRKGDIVITKDSEDPTDIGIPAIVAEDLENVVCGYHLTVIRVPEQYQRFVHRVIQADPTKARFYVESPGITRYGLNQDAIGGLPVVLPPPEEAGRLADFIDSEITRIDALVEKKTRFIELLGEKRRAVMTHAVTKGLDPNVPMKDSGAEWLGEVPEHWIVQALSRVIISRCDGPFGSAIKSETYSESGVRIVRLQNIGFNEFKGEDVVYIPEDYKKSEIGVGHDVLPGDLLMAGLGDDKNILGRVCVAPENLGETIVKADCYRFRVNSQKVTPTFLASQLSATAKIECGFISTGSTRARLNLSLAAFRVVAIPPTLAEQDDIANWVEQSTSAINRLIKKCERSIELLTERRSALITAAVTGQIDLRDATVVAASLIELRKTA